MVYVGHSKYRWGPMMRVLSALEPIRSKVGRIGLVGEGWGSLPWWATWMKIEGTYYSDAEYLRALEVEVMPPVPFGEVPRWMSRGVFNPVLLRPTFDRMRLVNPRMFETPASGTIPVFVIDEAHVGEICGESGLELTLDADASERLEEIVAHPEAYARVVARIRRHLAGEHSHRARLRQLISILEE